MPAPLLNTNSLKHGRKSKRLLPLGKLPKDCKYIMNRCGRLVRQLEASILAARGELTIADQARIQTAARYERAAARCEKWLRDATDAPLETQIAINRDIPKLSAERDKTIALLNLPDPHHSDPWACLTDSPGPILTPGCPDAAQAIVGGVAPIVALPGCTSTTDAPEGGRP